MAGAANVGSRISGDTTFRPDPGHSAHGEAFSQGPRSAAYLMKGTGDVHFPVTCKIELARKFFEQGVGQLHGFWYLEAERSFRQALAIDPSCVMAYWGMAMANINKADRARGFMEEAWKRKDSAGLKPIELAWIDALHTFRHDPAVKSEVGEKKLLADLKAMREEKFPKDLELKAFYVMFSYENGPREGYKAADKLLDEILAEAPFHPANHYRIHLDESLGNSKGALGSAARCGPSAPGIAHMWHMCGHTYSSLGRYADAAWYQEASARVDHAYMIRDRVMPNQIFNYVHNNQWLVTDLNAIGRAHDAADLAMNLIDIPRRMEGEYSGKAGAERLIDTLSLHQMWPEYLAACATGYLNNDVDARDLVRKLRYEGVANAALGRLKDADACIAKLEAERKKLLPTDVTPDAQPTTQPSGERSTPGRGTIPSRWRTQPATRPAGAPSNVAAIEPTTRPTTQPAKKLAAATGPTTHPTARARRGNRLHADELTAIEQAINHINAQKALQIGDFAKGASLLTLADAKKEHTALAYLAAGDFAKAQELIGQAVAAQGTRTYPLATQVLVLHRIGKKQEAAKAFASLRELSEGLDLTVEPYQSLCDIAPEYGFKADYRMPRKLPADTGARPPFDSLGPFRWHPPEAPLFSTLSASGSTISLGQYHGKPVILLFYLGHGCAHCVQQIHDFAAVARQFADAGISLLAIGIDSPDALGKTWPLAKTTADEASPFPLASDATMEIFKKYHCYDDFEKMPLHGTFLIDGRGRIRWQEIGAEPFLNPTFLLKESKRLLAQKTAG